ncbi:WD40-repeat-containing domain protein [Blastocladiella britannica]|nr:WD40-repeat-containing domain protein [Blastocladiella britannica]
MARPITLLASDASAHTGNHGVMAVVSGSSFVLVKTQDKSAPVTVNTDALAAHAHAQPIRALAFSPDGQFLATTGEDKILKVWATADGKQVSERVLEKRAVEVCVTPDNATVVVADKHGDAWAYPLRLQSGTTSTKPGDDGKIIAGHVSMVTACKLVANGTRLLTADRDEKVRVSRYPASFVVEGWLLSHSQFVAHIAPIGASETVATAGGDDWVGLWDWRSATLLARGDLRGSLGLDAAPAATKEESTTTAAAPKIAVRALVSHTDHIAAVVEGLDRVVVFRGATSGTLDLDRVVTVPAAIGQVLTAAYDAAGRLWLGGVGGLCVVDPKTHAVTAVPVSAGFGADAEVPVIADIYQYETLRKSLDFDEFGEEIGGGADAGGDEAAEEAKRAAVASKRKRQKAAKAEAKAAAKAAKEVNATATAPAATAADGDASPKAKRARI